MNNIKSNINMSPIFTAFETVNPEVCDKLALMSFNDFINFYDINEQNKGGFEDTARVQYEVITGYCQEQQKVGYNLERSYHHAAKASKGRIFVKGNGLQRIYNQFRGCLCDGLYYDIDMNNAHPTILLYLCRHNGIPASSLAEFVANRDHYLRELMADDGITRDEAKRLFLTSLNKSIETKKIGRKLIKNKFFLKFDKDIRDIQAKLKDRFPEEVKWQMANNWKAKENLDGCLTNILMTTIENEILCKVIDFLNNKKIIVDVPMFDGLMLRTESLKVPIEEIISQLDEITTEYGVKWSNKPHNTKLMGRILSLSTSKQIKFIGNNVIDIGKYLWDNVFKTRIVSCSGLLYFKSFNDNLYINEPKTIQNVIHNFVCEQDLHIENDKGVFPLCDSFKNVKNVVEHILSLAGDSKNDDPNFMETLFNRSTNKLNFNNGVYDFTTGYFNPDPNTIEGFFKIKYDYKDERDEDLIQELYNRVIDPMFGVLGETDIEQMREKAQLRDCILYRLARAVAGYYQDKNWFMLEGLRNSGKTVLMTLLGSCIGPYMTSTDSRNFLFKAGTSSNDSAKENMFLFGLQLHRIINIEEFTVQPGKQTFINGSVIKQVCSGGSYIETRAHYGMPMRIKCQASLLFAANEYPEISPADAMQTCTMWGMSGKFIKEGENSVPGYMNYPADETIKEFIKREDVGLAFMHILMDKLRLSPEERKYPESIRQANEEANEALGSNNHMDILDAVFRYTGCDGDILTNQQIISALVSKHIVMGKMVLAKTIKAMGGQPYKGTGGARGYKCLALVA